MPTQKLQCKADKTPHELKGVPGAKKPPHIHSLYVQSRGSDKLSLGDTCTRTFLYSTGLRHLSFYLTFQSNHVLSGFAIKSVKGKELH